MKGDRASSIEQFPTLRQFRLNLIRQPIHAHQYTGREVANRFRITLFDVQRVESAGIAGDGEAQLF